MFSALQLKRLVHFQRTEHDKMAETLKVSQEAQSQVVGENEKLRTEHDKMAATLKVSQEAHSQVVGELKAEIEKLKSDLKKANEIKELAIARLREEIKKEPPTTIQETLKVSQEAHSQVVGELKSEIYKLKSDLEKANETKELAIARLVEQIKKEPPTNIQEK